MTTILVITTAIFFVAWICAEVLSRIYKRAWNNAIEWKDLVQVERDKVQEHCDEVCEHWREHVDEQDKQLARVAEAVKEERAALTKTIEQLEQLFLSGRGVAWTRYVYDYISNDTLRAQVREEWDEKTDRLICRQTEHATKATAFLDEFVAEHLPAETSEAEEASE